MVTRRSWIRRIEDAWKRRSILWLSGVRRVGKTCLCQSVPGIEYFDCELPRVRRSLADPEEFLGNLKGKTLVLDEVHRLEHPAELLKIAADHFPGVRILATGSSTLGASAKFRDTLAGRKTELWLTPLTALDMRDFGREDLRARLVRGGLPPFFLAEETPERDFQEWVDAYWAKDVQELFRLERRHSFQRLLELLMAQSGGIFEASRFARPCEVSRGTISNYLKVLEATFIVHLVRPFSTSPPVEIVAAPKVYAFDTGFVWYHRGWRETRAEDLGLLWEHFVLNEIHANLQSRDVRYWRDKRGHEIDFVIPRRGRPPVAVECKWRADAFAARGLNAFRRRYPQGDNYVVAPDVDRPFARRSEEAHVRFVSLEGLIRAISGDA
jgi:hypothetical protein